MIAGESGICRIFIAHEPFVFFFHAEAIETLLASNDHIEKADGYKILHPWLGTGLLTRLSDASDKHTIELPVGAFQPSNGVTSDLRRCFFTSPSGGSKWRSRRKLLTPAFHFSILDDFVPLVNQQSLLLIEKLERHGKQDFDVVKDITLCTLDIICGTFSSRQRRLQICTI